MKNSPIVSKYMNLKEKNKKMQNTLNKTAKIDRKSFIMYYFHEYTRN